jgi:hypothetical protein
LYIGAVLVPAGKWGSVNASCDIPIETVETAFAWIAANDKVRTTGLFLFIF